jgi:hypothetical protein
LLPNNNKPSILAGLIFYFSLRAHSSIETGRCLPPNFVLSDITHLCKACVVYQLSKDYEKLFELICNGEVIAAFVDNSFRSGEHVSRDICSVKMNQRFDIDIGVRGVCYGCVYGKDTKEEGKEDFIFDCKKLNLGWISP